MSNPLSNLNARLAQSKALKSNDAAYQTIVGLINGLKTQQSNLAAAIKANNDALDNLIKITIVNIDTSVTAQTVDISFFNFKNHVLIFKDISGNASSNTITFVGTVDGVVSPVINTDYGIMRIYLGLTDNLYHTW